jgi:hypothetical protein
MGDRGRSGNYCVSRNKLRSERLGPEAAPLWELARDTTAECVMHLETFAEPLNWGWILKTEWKRLNPSYSQSTECWSSSLRDEELLHRVASTLQLKLLLENAAPHERQFSLPSPTCDEAALRRVLETHLETLHLEAALLGVRLKSTKKHAPSTSNWHSLKLRERLQPFGETLARLHALTGEQRVGVPRRATTHRPGFFSLLDPCRVFCSEAEPRPIPPKPLLKEMFCGEFPAPLKTGSPRAGFPSASSCVCACHEYRRPGAGMQRPLSFVWKLVGRRCLARGNGMSRWGGAIRGLYRLACEHGGAKSWTLEGCYDAADWKGPEAGAGVFSPEPQALALHSPYTRPHPSGANARNRN